VEAGSGSINLGAEAVRLIWNKRGGMVKNWYRVLLPLTLIAAPGIVEVWYIRCFAVNVPVLDEWALVPRLQALAQRNARSFLALLWTQHNEHRIVFPRLVLLALSAITGWNVVTEVYLSLFLAGLLLASLGLIYTRACRGSLWGFVPLSWLVFSLGQWENILWGWQLIFYLQTAAAVLGVYFLAGNSLRSLIWAILCGIVASFSLSNGLLIWPVGLLCLVLSRASKRYLVLWSLVGTLVVVGYLQGYTLPSRHPSPMLAFSQPLTTARFFLANVGAPLGGGDVELSEIVGTYLIVLLLVFLYTRLRATKRTSIRIPGSDIPLLSLVLLSLLSSTLIAVTRVGFGHLDWAINSRYITITLVGIAGIYLLFVKYGAPDESHSGNRLKRESFSPLSALLSVLVIGLAITNLHGIRMGEVQRAARTRMKYVLQTFDVQPDGVLEALYPSPQAVREFAAFLKEHRLSVFREPVELLLLTRPGGNVPAGEIVPDRPIVQAFRCPVQTLKDVEIFFATYARNNTSHIEITLADGDGPVVRQLVPSAQIEDNSWVHITLPKPIGGCMGRKLVLSIVSQDASPGNAVTVWMVPRYYEGELLEPAEISSDDRVVGLELNALAYEIWR